MRTYGRVYAPNGTYQWVEVSTASDGSDDLVWLTTLVQALKLSINESPFYGNVGIPATQSVLTQIFPDFYVTQMQAYFAPRFASLLISKTPSRSPVYQVNVTLNSGVRMELSVPV